VQDVRFLGRNQDQIAETQLRDILTGETNYQELDVGIAKAETRLTAFVNEGLEAEAAQRLELSVLVGDNAAAIEQESLTRATADSALASQITTLQAVTGDNAAAIQAESVARTNADSALASQITTLGATVSGNTAAIQNEATVRADADAAIAQQIVGLEAVTGANLVAIQEETIARTNADEALASQITTLQSTVGNNTTAIQVTSQTVDGIQGKYSVKIDNNGYVSGYGLISTANNAVPFADFQVIADRFAIAPVATDPDAVGGSPFFVITAPRTINGVSVSAGTYIKQAFLYNAVITTAKINDLAVTNAKIANASINTAKIADATITTAKIGDAQITDAKIANATITNAKIATLDAGKINTGTLSADRIAAGSITAAKIDSRNLTIRDGSNNIIFSASQNLDWNRVANQPANIFNSNIAINANGTLSGAGGGQVSLGGLGAGAFATLSQLNSSNISTYIASAAIGTALIQNAAITNALIANAAISTAKIADLAVGNAKIANGAISSAKIGDAQITTAKIGTAQIDTLRVAGNAITVQAAVSANFTNTSFTINAAQPGVILLVISIGSSGQQNAFLDVFVNGGLVARVQGEPQLLSINGDYGRTPATRQVLVNIGAGVATINANVFNQFSYVVSGFLSMR
jgi:hypothetical protein